MTVRISGFFRDAFPHVIALLDDAIRAVAALDEPAEINPLRAFDSDHEGTQGVMNDAPHLLDHLSTEDAEHFAEVRELLGAGRLLSGRQFGIPVEIIGADEPGRRGRIV